MPGSSASRRFRRCHYRHRLSPDSFSARHRGENVRADGSHGCFRASRLTDSVADLCPGNALDHLARRDLRNRELSDSLVKADLPTRARFRNEVSFAGFAGGRWSGSDFRRDVSISWR